MPLWSFEELMNIRGDMSEAEAAFIQTTRTFINSLLEFL
eukprot:CAMPEP_0201108532 /NCGR_PEP_ID=MMETSP0812-20130820/62005_1 /ASSEMBLY_ACC=CAM_ASM_000668 /TAXON_ID=98059 /ORGANISM="Dinobryon sp., Strain UTEXLB2267" /LENGTH=38 /DNA_ID= /DNA_START= /DNA_END= /DNA_ORIENTATION=